MGSLVACWIGEYLFFLCLLRSIIRFAIVWWKQFHNFIKITERTLKLHLRYLFRGFNLNFLKFSENIQLCFVQCDMFQMTSELKMFKNCNSGSRYIRLYTVRLARRSTWRPISSISASRLLLKLRMMPRDMMRSNVIILQVINYRLTGIIRSGASERSYGDTSGVLVELVIKVRACSLIANNVIHAPSHHRSLSNKCHACRRKGRWENPSLDFTRVSIIFRWFGFNFTYLLFLFLNFFYK